MRARPPMSVRLAVTSALGLLATACFDPGAATKGLPCTENGPCGSLSCEYGVCGGPVRCEAGAGVGDYCFTFEARELDVGPGIDALGLGNVDFDALPDVVVGNGNAQTVALLRNLGGGELAAAVRSAPLGISLAELAVGPVDGSEWADIVATAGGSTLLTIPIVPGTSGTGEIGAPTVIASGLAGAARPQIGQFVDDGDELPDVAVLVATGFDVFPQTAPATYGTGVHTEVAGSADLQKVGFDANPVFVASRTGNSVVAHSRVSGGAFTPTTTIDVGPSPSLFVVDDLDNDTFGDLLAVNESGRMWLTTGRDATFVMPRDPVAVYDLGFAATTLLAHNLDDDPEPELIVSGTAKSGRRDVYLFDNDGEGHPIYGGSLGIEDAASVVVADLDLDGAAEIIVASQDSGMIRVARRAVAPPPPGVDDTSTGTTTDVDPTVDPSTPTGPSLTTSPMTTDPSGTDTMDPTDDSSVDPTCPVDAVVIGSSCFTGYGPFFVSAPVLDLTVEPLDELGASLLALTIDGYVWAFPGGFFGTFDAKGYVWASTSWSPTGLAAGTVDLQLDPEAPPERVTVIVITHDNGFAVHSPTNEMLFTEFEVGASVAPVVGRFLSREGEPPFAGIAVGTPGDTLLHTLAPASLITGDPTLTTDVGAPVSDLDVILNGDFDAGLVVASGGNPSVYEASDLFAPIELGPLVEDTVSVYTKPFFGPAQAPLFATASSEILDVYEFVDEQDAPMLIHSEQVLIVSDLAAANIDGAPGDELLALVHYGDYFLYLRVWTLSEFGFVALADLSFGNLTAFAVSDAFGLGASDILLAFTDEDNQSGILHLGLVP